VCFFFFQAEDGIRDFHVTGVQTCALPIFRSVTLRMRDLMEEWKAVGFAGREHDDALWRRFQAARDTFGERRKVWFEENADRKQEIGRASCRERGWNSGVGGALT